MVDIRMMRDREGNLRGFGYIEYADEAGAQAGTQFTCCTSTYVQIQARKQVLSLLAVLVHTYKY